ncbi:MAG: Crp/Fnr family transcriptional regulator [Nitrospirae bacterium]|nr:MAG: Crp/Fnr family transcriptional regulator [Nitrospirota bacterium]
MQHRQSARPIAKSMTDCVECPNRQMSELCDWHGAVASELKTIKHTVVYRPGQFLFYEGHAALGLYILCRGRVKLTRSTAKGQQRLLAIVEPGHLIEKHLFATGSLHEATCETLEMSEVCILDRVRYLSLLERYGHVAVKLLQLLSREMVAAFEEADQLAFASARERLVSLLLELAERYGEPVCDGVRIALQLKREELAQMAVLTVETTVRLLQALQADCLIRLRGREITILKPDRLTAQGVHQLPSAVA